MRATASEFAADYLQLHCSTIQCGRQITISSGGMQPVNSVVERVLGALRKFSKSVTEKMTGLAAGEPEDQLRGPFEVLLKEVGAAIGTEIVAKGESRLVGRLGRPDYAVLANKLLAGYVELKAPGTGAHPSHFKGHDRKQWERFKAVPNLLYCDGNEWGLYRAGVEARPVVLLVGDVSTDEQSAVNEKNAEALVPLLTDFLFWQPIVPSNAKELAEFIAPICRLLRDEVLDALADTESPLLQVAKDWRQLLFPDASNDQFADAYAQTIIFGLLLARSEGATTLELHSAIAALAAKHTLLSKALEVLTDPQARLEIEASLALAQRVIDQVPVPAMTVGKNDPWLYFYENFLAAYDSDLRRDAGAYYTPVEVVRSQTRLIGDLLARSFGKAHGFADETVITLDPAVGTGTYLLGIIDHALQEVEDAEGQGAIPGRASTLAKNLYGFENMVGPYAVTELRLTRALKDRGATLADEGPRVFLTDTLESPNTTSPQFPLLLRAMSDQHKRALQVKKHVPVIVCLGNPPYDRHEAADGGNKSRTGGWVRWGDLGSEEPPILESFVQPAKDAGHGGDVKNLYNLYVYFWRWALWKVFEQRNHDGPGIVSFISAASYMDGDAFVGMREHIRRVCDEVWIIDLGGEGRGPRQSDNVFAIQTPVAIAVAARFGIPQPDVPAAVHYTVVEGSRSEKLLTLNKIKELSDLQWEDCPKDWHSPFRPAGVGAYFSWPLLTDLLPWQHSGVQLKRTWPIAPDVGTLRERWRSLLADSDRRKAFRETGDRRIGTEYKKAKLTSGGSTAPIGTVPKNSPVPPIRPYAYRSFDRQYLIADGRLISRPRPTLWSSHSEQQVYLTTLIGIPLGNGPATTACGNIPDMHHFRGSYGAKETMPLWRDAASTEANVAPGC